MVSIYSGEENRFMKKLVSSVTTPRDWKRFWIGGSEENARIVIGIGLTDPLSNIFPCSRVDRNLT